MSQSKAILLGGAITTTVGLLYATLYVSQSKLRKESKTASEKVVRCLRRLETTYKVDKMRLAALQESLRRGQEEIALLLQSLVESAQVTPPGVDDTTNDHTINSSEELALEAEEVEGESDDAETQLPPLPANVHATGLIRSLNLSDLKSVVNDPFFNPEGKALNRVQGTELAAVMAEAKGSIETLDRQITAIAARAMEDLRARYDYVVYAEGEYYHNEKGVYTAAEQIDNAGTRMFYLFPDEFPEIYEKQAERRAVSEKAVRKLISMFAATP